MTTYPLFQGKAPGAETEVPRIDHYSPKHKRGDAAVLVFPGGAYSMRAPYEGGDCALFLNELGLEAFVVHYRVKPAKFPDPLLDARRAVRFVRANAEKFGIDPDRILVLGFSAGGHLAAMTCNFRVPLAGEGVDGLDEISPYPNGQILCYPVISADDAIIEKYSFTCLLGERYAERAAYDAAALVHADTPRAFIWHTSEDELVDVENSYRYATALRRYTIPTELHIFPFGRHGLGLAEDAPHVAKWKTLLANWLSLYGDLHEEN